MLSAPQNVKWSLSKKSKDLLTLAELTSLDAQVGRVTWIGMRPGRKDPVFSVESGEITRDGLLGDRARVGKRALTLFQHEHLPVLASFLNQASIDPKDLRRNIHVRGLNLSALRAVPLQIGEAVIEITVPCAPCSRMHATFGPGGYNALRGHGGWCATIVRPGHVHLGASVRRLDGLPG